MYIGAFDIGGTKTIVALADETGKIYEKQQYPTDTADCLRHLDSCCEIFLQFMHKHQLQPNQILGIGVNLPGIVDRKQGILLRAVYAGWHDVPVKYEKKPANRQKIAPAARPERFLFLIYNSLFPL